MDTDGHLDVTTRILENTKDIYGIQNYIVGKAKKETCALGFLLKEDIIWTWSGESSMAYTSWGATKTTRRKIHALLIGSK